MDTDAKSPSTLLAYGRILTNTLAAWWLPARFPLFDCFCFATKDYRSCGISYSFLALQNLSRNSDLGEGYGL
jgi:hypothetical protein